MLREHFLRGHTLPLEFDGHITLSSALVVF